MQMTYFKTH